MGTGMKKRLTAATAALVAGILFALPAPAGAQECDGPTGDQYCESTEVLTASGSGSGTDPGDSDGGLPFTGLDLGLEPGGRRRACRRGGRAFAG